MQPNLQLGSSGSLSKNFHGVGIGPLSKILAVNISTTFSALKIDEWFFGAVILEMVKKLAI